MKVRLQIILWTSVFLLILFRNGHSINFDWSSVVPYLYEMCGVEQDCRGIEANLDGAKSHTKNICCKGCLCGDDCYENERIENQYAGLTNCSTTVRDARTPIRYRFIVNEPKDGCTTFETSKTDILPSCQSEVEAAPWGNFYPVYSFDKRANFKNEQCALCHGAINTVKWNVYAFFWGKNHQRIGIFRRFYHDFNSSDMNLAFYPPNGESQAYEHICHDVKSGCSVDQRDTFHIPTSINLTREQVIQACKEGIISPYIFSKNDVFKNIFCAICSTRVLKSSDSLICDKTVIDVDDNIKGSGQSFASLIDQSFIESKLDESKGNDPVHLACLTDNSSDHAVKKPCREVLCPALQVRQHDGTCRYPMNKIFTTRFTVHLNLTTPDIGEDDVIWNIPKAELETIFKRTMPWPRNWELIELFRRTDTLHTNTSELYVSVGYKNVDFVDIKYLRRLIDATLLKNWTIDFGRFYNFRQSIHKHGLFKKSGKTGGGVVLMKPQWAIRPGINDIFLNLTSPTWEVLVFNSPAFYYKPPGDPFEITKLYFCDQIEMYDFEFVGSTNDFPIISKRSGRILYPWQFYMHKGENGTRTLNVCMEDSDFELVLNTNGGLFPRMSLKALMFLLVKFTTS